MKKIIVKYWKKSGLVPSLVDGQEFEYSKEKREEIVETVFESGCSMMFRPNMGEENNILYIFIDNGRFGQS